MTQCLADAASKVRLVSDVEGRDFKGGLSCRELDFIDGVIQQISDASKICPGHVEGRDVSRGERADFDLVLGE